MKKIIKILFSRESEIAVEFFSRYGDMTPKTVIGRILACSCALSGPAMIGMLVSVLVDRYQRVYNRKLYISDTQNEPIDLEILKRTDIRTKLVLALPRMRHGSSSAISKSNAESQISVQSQSSRKNLNTTCANDNFSQNEIRSDEVIVHINTPKVEENVIVDENGPVDAF